MAGVQGQSVKTLGGARFEPYWPPKLYTQRETQYTVIMIVKKQYCMFSSWLLYSVLCQLAN